VFSPAWKDGKIGRNGVTRRERGVFFGWMDGDPQSLLGGYRWWWWFRISAISTPVFAIKYSLESA